VFLKSQSKNNKGAYAKNILSLDDPCKLSYFLHFLKYLFFGISSLYVLGGGLLAL